MKNNKKNLSQRSKILADVGIFACVIAVIGFFELGCSILLFLPISRLGENETRNVLFGVILLNTKISFAIYLFCMALVRLLCAWGLIKYIKFFWYLTLAHFLYDITDSFLLFRQDKFNAVIGIVISIIVITWLYLRRQVYFKETSVSHE